MREREGEGERERERERTVIIIIRVMLFQVMQLRPDLHRMFLVIFLGRKNILDTKNICNYLQRYFNRQDFFLKD